MNTTIKLQKIKGSFSVCKITNANEADFTREFVFITKTPDEISLVCESDCVPTTATAVEHGWKAFRVSGILDFGLIGILSKIAGILAKEKISIFAVSTYNTDYVLVKTENFDAGMEALIRNGYAVDTEAA